MAFSHFGGGHVTADPDAYNFIGADCADSMSAEMSAQVYAACMILVDTAGLGRAVPVTMHYDNEAAAAFARAVSRSRRHLRLHSVVGVVWQILALERRVTWWHVQSHRGHPLNELVDSLVEYMAKMPEAWLTESIACTTWCRTMEPEQIKLLYLLRIPTYLADCYPQCNE